jgi:hypothetical protein
VFAYVVGIALCLASVFLLIFHTVVHGVLLILDTFRFFQTHDETESRFGAGFGLKKERGGGGITSAKRHDMIIL